MTRVMLSRLVLHTCPKVDVSGCSNLWFSVEENGNEIYANPLVDMVYLDPWIARCFGVNVCMVCLLYSDMYTTVHMRVCIGTYCINCACSYAIYAMYARCALVDLTYFYIHAHDHIHVCMCMYTACVHVGYMRGVLLFLVSSVSACGGLESSASLVVITNSALHFFGA